VIPTARHACTPKSKPKSPGGELAAARRSYLHEPETQDRDEARAEQAAATPRVPASTAQRRKVAGLGCLVCGRRPVDPAHIVPRRLGGCDSPDCVVALCRAHHRSYDAGLLALAPYLAPELERELRHALTHAACAELEAALWEGWPAPWALEMSKTNDGGR
jgi:hypothetical protein